ncbi:uncharacterized protein LOC131974190 [Centropristis striata]|uniref:uncharacterized protein LOC131974190 n=1 Tax=Centropristis striata TaxID=184440 RepID=UPI0027E0E691|nr:uncharacterized protein LOC131974190 [Centropristis striata]XP_059192396.1 uncharacterized protein LOC131974190 [Centropristis striata]
MNPLDWDVSHTLRNLHPNHQNNVHNSMDNMPRTYNEWGTYCEFSRHTVDEAQRSEEVNVRWQGPSPPTHNFYNKDSEFEDPDGGPLEMDEEDPELSRKRKELQHIEERIILKKAAIALKTVELFVTNPVPSDSSNDHSAPCRGETLKDRVNVILKQRHPPSFLSKVSERMKSSSQSRYGPLQDNHPLKLRVNALMKQRCSDLRALPAIGEVPVVTLPSARGSIASPANEENNVNKGFQRFLSVLNEGVDMDYLSRIVIDDSEGLPLGKELPVQPPALENKSDPVPRSKSQQSNCGASLSGGSRSNSGERKTDLLTQERSLNERLPLPDDEENIYDRGNLCFGSSSRSKSPPAVKKKQKNEEVQPKVNEQHGHLQNILKTGGLSLEVEETKRLVYLTKDRLYGKKHEDTTVDSRGEQESQLKSSQRHYSVSSSSSASSRSTRSRSSSPSTSQHQGSHSRDSKQWFGSSCSRGRSRVGLKHQDDNQDSKEAHSYRDEYDKVTLPLSGSITSSASEENKINKGFQRFLSLLNKGVDIDYLSRIVTDDSEDLPLGKELPVQPPALENKSDPVSRSKSQQSNCGASLSDGSRSNSGERKTDLPSQERSLVDGLSLPDNEEKRNDRGHCSFGSSSRSKSPVKKKNKKEEQPNVDEQHGHLQNILKTLGLNLEVEEMNKLAQRTQERLYGKTHGDTKVDSRGDQESQEKSSQRHDGIPSSSSRLTRSRGSSPSTSQHQGSHSCSEGRSRDGLKRQDDNQSSKDIQSYRDTDDKEISTYQHPYSQNQTYPHAHPAAFSEFPDYSLAQHSQYYNAGTNSYWTHGNTPTPPSLNHSSTFHHFPGPVKTSGMVYPHHNPCQDINLLMNPDLSTSEGQIGSLLGPRCLQVISTKQPTTERCIMQLTKRRKNRTSKGHQRKLKERWIQKKIETRKRKMEERQKLMEMAEVPQPGGAEEDSQEEKKQPTEDEVKSKLRKWLDAYNKKMKKKCPQQPTQ